jgi:hypothetical protein
MFLPEPIKGVSRDDIVGAMVRGTGLQRPFEEFRIEQIIAFEGTKPKHGRELVPLDADGLDKVIANFSAVQQ